jgi:hypothetical protein
MSRTVFFAAPGSRRPYVPAAALKDARAERDVFRALLVECRDFIDHRPHHDHPFQPDTPCCDLERRVDEALGGSA